MPVSTEGEVFRELLVDLQAIALAQSSINGDRVYTRATFGFDPDTKPPYIRLISGSATIEDYERAGALVKQTFQVAIFNRLVLGEPGIDTDRISNATYGLLAIRDAVRGDGGGTDPGPGDSPSGLLNRIVAAGGTDITAHPIVLLSWDAPQANPADPYWHMCKDTYRFYWEMA